MIIVLQNGSGQQLGFVLFAGNPASNDCVVRPLPKDPSLFETPEFRFLERFKEAGEFKYSFEDQSKRLVISKPPLSLRFEKREPEGHYVELDSGLAILGLPYEPPRKS